MLTMFRSLMKGPGKYVFLILIFAAFGVVGVPALSNFGRTEVLKVGDVGFTLQDIDDEFTTLFLREQRTGTPMSREEAIAGGMLDEAIQQLTADALILQEARKLGLAVTDEMIQEYIQTNDLFQDPRSGQFDPSLVQPLLRANNLTMSEFRQIAERDILVGQLEMALALNLPAPAAYADYFLLRESEERDVTLARLGAGDLADPEESELLSYFEANAGQYRDPEFRTITLVVLNDETVSSRIEVDEAELQQLFDARYNGVGSPERRSFAQGQFRDFETATRVLEAVRAGANFEDTVEAEGGSLLTFREEEKSILADETVADAIYGTEETGLVGPIDGLFGIVIAEVTAITEETAITLDDVRDELEEAFKEELVREEVFALDTEIQEMGDAGLSLADAADSVGVEFQLIGPIDAQGRKADDSLVDIPPAALRTAFVAADDGFFEGISLPGGGYAYIAVEDITAERALSFDEVADRVQQDYRANAVNEALEAQAEQIRQAVLAGEPFDEAATARGAQVTVRKLRAAEPPADIPIPLYDSILSDPMGDVLSAPLRGTDEIMIAQVTNLRFGPNAQAEAIQSIVTNQLGQAMSTDTFGAYFTAMEQEAGVEINWTLINQRFGTSR